MPHAALRITPGVDQNETVALNEAGLSFTQLIRFVYDRNGYGLVQKLGGWSAFYSIPMQSTVRALWAWEDTNAQSHLAIGQENLSGVDQAQLNVLTAGVLQDVTPTQKFEQQSPTASTTAGSPYVTITDMATLGINQFISVYIPIHISIGGLVVFGLYQCDPDGFIADDEYHVLVTDVLGNPIPATSSSTSPLLPDLSVTMGINVVTVTLNDHGYVIGSTFPVLIETVVGGVTFAGNYIVQTVIDENTFTILGSNIASSTTTGYVGNGEATYIYCYGVGALPAGTGYGTGGYGTGGYGRGTGVSPATGGTPITAVDWTLDNWGEILIAVPLNHSVFTVEGAPPFQPIYMYDPTGGEPTATIIPQAPPVNGGAFVAMPQRQIVAWGSTATGVQDPLLINWCDVNNFNEWFALTTNQAGSYRLTRGSRIIGALQGAQQALIWTDVDLWSMQYIGPPYVYSFNEIGSGCGLIGIKAAASINGLIFWMGLSQFFSLSAEGVQPVPCSVWDVVFQNLDLSNVDKIRAAVNSLFNEITWYYPSLNGGGEVDSYVKLNVFLGVWDFGVLGRTAWIDQSVLGPPIGADATTNYVYQHEVSPDAAGKAMQPSFQTGYFAIGDGELKTFVDQFWPDMKWGYFGGIKNATVNITFYCVDYPGQTPTVFGPYSVTQNTQFFSPRFRARLVSVGISGDDVGTWWRIGNPRYRFVGDGKF